MTQKQRAVDVLTSAFDVHERRKFEVKNKEGEIVLTLFFRAITRSDRKRANGLTPSGDGLDLTTNMLIQKAELEDGSPAFQSGDAVALQRELPEKVLNDLELFLFAPQSDTSLEDAKKA